MSSPAHDVFSKAPDSSHEHVSSHEEPLLAEPETPAWLTLVGFLLFLAGGVGWVVMSR